MSLVQPLHVLCGAVLVALVLRHWNTSIAKRARRRGLPLPPGPKRWPLLGNLLNAPSSWKPWIGYTKLISEHGDVAYLEVLGQPMIVLGSSGVMFEFLERRAAVTSDRPQSRLFSIAGQEGNIGILRYGPGWRRLRRAFWQHFHSGIIPSYRPTQELYTRKALARFLEKPSDNKDVIRFAFAGTILKFVYELEVEHERDARIVDLHDAFAGVHEITAPMQLVLETLPFLSHFPTWTPKLGALLSRLANCKAAHERIMKELYTFTKNRVASGEDNSSMVYKLLVRTVESNTQHEEEIVIPIAAVAAEAGADTMSSTTEGFFLAMSLYPQVQEKAWRELNAVVGPDRLPDFNDEENLVYVKAIIKEALRWHNVVPLGMFHMTTEDEELRGYFVPAGTMVVPNVWACMHDPEIYPEPDTFNPDRFIRNGRLRDDVLDPASIIFGFGRRKCPGRYFADAMLYIIIATVLHVFDIRSPLDKHGRPIKVELEQSHGFISFPEDCRCVVTPRSARTETLLRESLASDV
ncbi:cytochrome P450 [Cubamyces lactineus]|nr:cytochrome P450 [Cubamyces lactineus]